MQMMQTLYLSAQLSSDIQIQSSSLPDIGTYILFGMINWQFGFCLLEAGIQEENIFQSIFQKDISLNNIFACFFLFPSQLKNV